MKHFCRFNTLNMVLIIYVWFKGIQNGCKYLYEGKALENGIKHGLKSKNKKASKLITVYKTVKMA